MKNVKLKQWKRKVVVYILVEVLVVCIAVYCDQEKLDMSEGEGRRRLVQYREVVDKVLLREKNGK